MIVSHDLDGVARPPHALGPGVVRALPALPPPPRRPHGRRRRAGGARARLPLHDGRPDGRGRRLPRGPARADRGRPRARRPRPARDRSVARAHGRVPLLGRDDDPQPRDGLGRRRPPGRGDADRLPPRHVRPLRADAPAAASRRHRAGRRLPRRAGGGRLPRVLVALPRRHRHPHRVPRQQLRQRRRRLRQRRRPRTSCRAARTPSRTGMPGTSSRCTAPTTPPRSPR